MSRHVACLNRSVELYLYAVYAVGILHVSLVLAVIMLGILHVVFAVDDIFLVVDNTLPVVVFGSRSSCRNVVSADVIAA